jgi:hypothetical protein
MLVFETLKNKISDFLNSNTCFCSRLYGSLINQKNNTSFQKAAVKFVAK